MTDNERTLCDIGYHHWVMRHWKQIVVMVGRIGYKFVPCSIEFCEECGLCRK